MTTLISREPVLRMNHHPANVQAILAQEAKWRAYRRRERWIRVMAVVTMLSVATLILALYFK